MSAESQAYDTLSGAAAVTALVSTRIYPDFVPQEKTLPSIAITRADTEYTTTIHSDVPVVTAVQLEIWCMAATRLAAEAVADAALSAVAAADFRPVGRRPETDAAAEMFATVLTMEFWE